MKIILIELLLIICNIVTLAQTTNQLPIIKLTGDFGYDYQQGTVTIEYPDGTANSNLTARIKWRGGSTNTEDKHKRNYKIKFNEDYSFFGFRKDNNWILDAGQADVFRLRNRIATELWNDYASKPYYSPQEPNALSGVRGQIVELYLNDEYRGIYSFTECMDRKQMKLKKFDKDGTIHGCLWKSTGYGSSVMTIIPENYDNSQPMMDVFEAKYPEAGDDLPETDYSTLWNAINFVVNSSDEDFINYVNDYFDIPVIIDYYLFINVLNAIDNTGKNMYWAVYDKQENYKITPAIWDLDLTVGSHYLEYYQQGFSQPDFAIGDGINVITRLKNLNVDNFNEKVTNRYKELRKNVFSPEQLISRYQSYYTLLKESGASIREEYKWSGDSDLNGDIIDYDQEMLYITNWINNHIKYLDENCFGYKDNTFISNVFFSSDKEQNIYTINGQRINELNPFRKGIYIKNGKKIIQ